MAAKAKYMKGSQFWQKWQRVFTHKSLHPSSIWTRTTEILLFCLILFWWNLCTDQFETATSPPPLRHLNFWRLDRSNSLHSMQKKPFKCPTSIEIPSLRDKFRLHSNTFQRETCRDDTFFWRLFWKSFSLTKAKFYLVNPLRRLATVFFVLGVYLLKSKFRIEDKLRFPWYHTTFSTNDQSLFSHWFPSNSCHHSNGNGQLLILNNVEYLEN